VTTVHTLWAQAGGYGQGVGEYRHKVCHIRGLDVVQARLPQCCMGILLEMSRCLDVDNQLQDKVQQTVVAVVTVVRRLHRWWRWRWRWRWRWGGMRRRR
jgi:hypothetical protein